MFEGPLLWEWASFAARWVHVVTAIAWIGSSFYFIALDLGLRKAQALPEGAHGEEWQVHGGGFYHIQKYLVAPAAMPEHLTWFKWESYATWVSGFALLSIVYYGRAELYLIDPEVWDVSVPVATAVSLGSLAGGWIVYDVLCRSPLGKHPTVLMILLYMLLVVLAWVFTHVFTGRAAMLHLGAITATIMSANVFLVIIPNQRIVVADLKAGRTPDAMYGQIAKLRSTHNNYLTLPVLFLMLSNHYPLAFATEYNWVIASLVFLMGVSIRHFFNTMHARQGRPYWTWAATTALFLAIVWLSSVSADPAVVDEEEAALSSTAQAFAASEHFEEVTYAVLGRCSMCHAEETVWDGIGIAPKGVKLETAAQIAQQAREIYLQAGVSKAMPPANVSYMEPEERALIVTWYRSVADGGG